MTKILEQNLEYARNVNEIIFLANETLLFKERGSDAHRPTLVTIEPSDMSRQERRSFLTDDSGKRQEEGRTEG